MRTNRFALVLLAACAVALGAPAPPAQAEDSFSLGSQYWLQTVDEAKFQEFRDVPRGVFLESLNLDLQSGRNAFALAGINGFRKDQSWHGQWSNGAALQVRGGWFETPHRFSLTTRTPFTEVRPGVFVLPDSFQALNRRVSSATAVTNAFNDALNASPRFPLEFSTDVASARVRVRPRMGWMVEANGRQTTRAGKKAYGALIGTSPGNPMVELWEPIDHTFQDADVRANFSNDRLTFQAIGSVSLFDNAIDRMTWDNPRALFDVPPVRGVNPPRDSIASIPGRGQMALAPDNREVRGSVAVGVQLPRHSLFTGTVGVAQITQDQEWIPVSINAALRPDTIPLPGTHTDGKANVVNLDARLTTMAVDRVRGTLRFHSDKYDNQTPTWHFSEIVNGDVAKVGPEETKPFSNNNWVAGLDLDADPMNRVSVGVTAELRTRERDHREVTKDSETVLGGRVRVRPMTGLALDARGSVGKRELDAFHIEDYENDAGALIEQPTMRRPDVANRQQTAATAGVTWMPMELLDLSASYAYLENDYQDLDYGLTKDENGTFAAQATVHPTPRLDLRGGYGLALIKTAQRSIQGGSATIVTGPGRDSLAWTADIEDENTHVNAGIDFWLLPDKLALVADYEFTRDQVTLDLTAGPAFTSPSVSASNRFTGDVPTTFYRRHEAVFEARFQILPGTQLTGRYGWEEFDIIDFAAKDVPQVGPGAAALYLGDFYRDYRAHRVALLVKHTFGP
jgi:MtrB/PioB family decaheme-associated outer membrane protein